MSELLDGPVGVDLRAPLARRNPLAKLSAALAVSVALLLTIDAVTAATALALELAALPFAGLGPRALARRGWAVLLAASGAAVSTAWLGVDSGPTLVDLGPVTVSQGSLLAGVGIGLRVLAIGVPGVVLLATTDPTDLADALAQRLHLPAAPVLSALAGMRLFGVLAQEWEMLTLARRARGLGGHGRLAQLGTVGGQTFALLVLALRRATTMATAMEARGFGVRPERTWARPSLLDRGDLAMMAGGVLLAVAATGAGLAAGTWSFVLG